MSGHDVFPEAKVVVFPPTTSVAYPNVTVSVEETIAVIEAAPEGPGSSLIVIVAQAFDHHGEDVRELVAQRIAEGLAQ